MAEKLWSGLLAFTRPARRGHSAPRPAGASLMVEVLENRLVPSGGPGPSGTSGGPGSSSPPAITSGSSGSVIVTGSSGKTFQMGALIQALSTGGMTISQLFSGYPLAPNGGPSLQGDLLTLGSTSSVPMPMQNSTVAVVPVLLTSAGGSGSGSLYTLVLLDPATGATYSVPVSMTSPSTGGGG